MREPFEKAELEQAYKVVQARIVKFATMHLPGVDIRTATALQLAGILPWQEKSALDPTVVEVLLNKRPDAQLPVPHGPHIFYRESAESISQYVFEIASGFFESSPEIRNACLDQLLRTTNPGDDILLERTRSILLAERDALQSESTSVWKRAALTCYDKLDEDMLYHLAGVRQMLAVQFDEGIRRHIDKILRPSRKSVELAMAEMCSFLVSADYKAKVLAEIASAETLEDACDEYLIHFGYLPMAGSAAFAVVISAWLDKRKANFGTWERIWQWASNKADPAAVSMACAFFLQRPGMVPKEDIGKIWSSILKIIPGREACEATRNFKLMLKVKETLAFNTLSYIHSAFPSMAEAHIDVFAWWLAQRTLSALSSNSRSMTHLLNEFLEPAAQNAVLSSQVASVPISWSQLGMITRCRGNPWTLSLLSSIGFNSKIFVNNDAPKEFISRLEESLITSILNGCALIESDDQSVLQLSFEPENMHELVGALAQRADASDVGRGLPVLYWRCVQLARGEACLLQFEKITTLNETDQLLVARMLKHALISRQISFVGVWEILSVQKWRECFFKDVPISVLAVYFDAFAVGQQITSGPWTLELPGLYASACEAARDDEEKANALFLFTVVSSVHSYSCSAIERLVSGEHRPSFERAVEDARRLLTDEIKDSPPWIKARGRSLLPCLDG